MPGVFGGCSVENGSPAPHERLVSMARALTKTGAYRPVLPAPESAAGIGVVDPAIRPGLASFGDFPDRGIAIALYGELYGPSADATTDPLAFLADWYAGNPRTAPSRAATLDGSFVIAIHDYRERELLLINDHTASRPLYYMVAGDLLHFSPELRGLSCLPGFDPTISLGCLVSFLTNGTWLNDATIYSAVRSLPPASTLLVRDGRVAIRRYWEYTFRDEQPDEGLDAYVEGLAPLLRNAVRKRLDATPDLSTAIVPISGGYDSRGILAALREMHDGPLMTVTWGTGETDPEGDGYVGRRVAERLDTRHQFMRREGSGDLARDVREMVHMVEGSNDDPMHHRTELSTMRQIARLGATDLLRGDTLCGYHGGVETDAEALASVGILQAKDTGPVLSVLSPRLAADGREAYHALIEQLRAGTSLADPNNRKDYYYFSARLLHLLHRSSYYKLSVLDVKQPWLDVGVLDFYKDVPARYRMDKILYARTIDRMFPNLRDIPYATRHSLEDWPHQVRTDPDLRRFISSVLLEHENGFDEYVDPARLRSFVEACLADRSTAPRRASAVHTAKEVIRRVSPALYRGIKKRVMPRVAVPQTSPVPLLFRLVIAKLWFDERDSVSAYQAGVPGTARVKGDPAPAGGTFSA